MTAPRPTVTLKIATSLDGRIATAAGESRWITGEAAREEVHRLRASHDAVLVGSQTVLDDDPELTVRLPGYTGPQPAVVVADGRLRTPATARLFSADTRGARAVFVVASTSANEDSWLEALRRSGPILAIALIKVAPGLGGTGVDVKELVNALPLPRRNDGSRGNRTILLEGGGKLAASFLRAGLIDRIEWFRAPIILGGDGRPAVAALELGRLADAPRFKRLDVATLGDDLWERYERLT